MGSRLTPLVNRTEEVTLLLTGWQQAKAHEGQVVLLAGEPGIGKSRIVQELRERIASDQHRQISFQCSPYYSSTAFHPDDYLARGKKLTFEVARFIKFIITEIFPGGRLPTTQMMVEHGEKAGFVVPETMSLRNHYIKTLGIWADALERNKDAAIAATDEENYHRYMRYLKGAQYYFIDEAIDVSLVTYLKPDAAA